VVCCIIIPHSHSFEQNLALSTNRCWIFTIFKLQTMDLGTQISFSKASQQSMAQDGNRVGSLGMQVKRVESGLRTNSPLQLVPKLLMGERLARVGKSETNFAHGSSPYSPLQNVKYWGSIPNDWGRPLQPINLSPMPQFWNKTSSI